MNEFKTDIGHVATKKILRCDKCSNLKVVFGGLHCEGYGCFNHLAKKCGKNQIKGKFVKKIEVDNEKI